jgi:hypothetical protein
MGLIQKNDRVLAGVGEAVRDRRGGQSRVSPGPPDG